MATTEPRNLMQTDRLPPLHHPPGEPAKRTPGRQKRPTLRAPGLQKRPTLRAPGLQQRPQQKRRIRRRQPGIVGVVLQSLPGAEGFLGRVSTIFYFLSFSKVFLFHFLDTLLCLETNTGLLRVEVVCKIEKYFYGVCKLDKSIYVGNSQTFKIA
jgi:hypothetical protein